MTNLDFVTKDLARRPVDERLVRVDTVNHEGATSADVVNALIGKFLHTGRLDDDVKSVWVFLLERFPLRARVLAVELEVLVSALEILRDVHLDTLVRSDHDAVRAVELQQLRENQPGRASAEHEHFNADGWGELVKTVERACCGLEEGGILIREVLDFVELVLLAEETGQ